MTRRPILTVPDGMRVAEVPSQEQTPGFEGVLAKRPSSWNRGVGVFAQRNPK